MTTREFDKIVKAAEAAISDSLSVAFDEGYNEGYTEAEVESEAILTAWEKAAEKFYCYSPEELEAWYNDMLTRMAEVANEQELQS